MEDDLVWGSEEFINTILDDMRASADLFEFDMKGDLETIRKKQPDVAKQIEQGKINIANHIDFIDLMEETIDRTKLPKGMDKDQALDKLLELVEYAQYTHRKNNPDIPILGVTDIQAQDSEFKKILTSTFDKAGEYVNTGDYINEDLADGDMMNAQYDSEIEIPDTVPEDLVEEVDRERFREFLELQEPEGTVLYDDADRADTFKDNLIAADDTNTIESFAEIAKNEELPTYEDVVNQYNQQLDNVVDNIPIEKIAKKKLKDKVLELSTRLLTPGGAMDLVDAYETIVFGLGMMVAAAPELKNIASYYSTLAANHIGKAYGMNIPVDKLEPDWEHINKVMDQVEAVTPTDILINKVMDREQKGNTYVSSYLPGFLPQSTIKNDDVSTTLEKTLMNMPINKGKTETSSDKLKESLIYGSTK